MKKLFAWVSVLMVVGLCFAMDLEARGGARGGGGGGRGGGSIGRGGGGGQRAATSRRPPTRSPSMSRSTQPRRSPQRDVNMARGNPRQSSRGNGRSTATRNDVQQFLQQNPSQRIDSRNMARFDTGALERPVTLPDRGDFTQGIRDRIGQDRTDFGGWFSDNFYNGRGYRPPYYNNNNGQWWRYATAAGVGSWLGWNSNPYYYGYYDDGFYEWPSDAYDSGNGSSEVYAEQKETIQNAPQGSTSDEWMPLGVFALTRGSNSQTTPNIYLQLALNKEGLLSGTYYNTSTDAAYGAEGVVDQETQRAAWKVVDNEGAPILETGIYNLTRDDVPVRVNFSDGTSQEMLLVRLAEK